MGIEGVGFSAAGKKSGPHYEKRLKAAFVKVAPPGRHTDGAGLYLEVDPSGARRWLVRLVVKGRRRDFGLGSASLVSLADARVRAHEFRRIARSGGDPTPTRHCQIESVAFRTVAAEVHKTHIKNTSRNGKHVDQWLNTLSHYAFPYIGDRGVDDISSGDIAHLLAKIWVEKQETARRVLQRLKVVFDWATVKGYRSGPNPVEGVRMALPRQKQKVKHFAAIPWEKTPDLMAMLEKTSGIGAVTLRFTILTALRSGAVRRATWDQFNDDLNTWTIPAANMKANEEFIVPLPMAAIAILREMKTQRSEASPYVFPSPSKPRQPISENTMSKVLKGFYPDATVHGMRSAFRDWAEIFAEARREVKEYALAHSNGNKVESAYLRTQYLVEREDLMDVWGEWATGAEGTHEDILNAVRIKREEPV